MAVVAVDLAVRHLAEAVADVEAVRLSVAVGEVALCVVAQADDAFAAATVALDVRQAPLRVVAVMMIAGVRAADRDAGEVV